MTTKVVADGNRIKVTAPTGGYTSGQGQEVGEMLGVVAETVTGGATAVLILNGVHTLTKVAEASSALVQGGPCYYRVTGGEAKLTGVAAGADGYAGTAWAVAVTGATTAQVKLMGQAVQDLI